MIILVVLVSGLIAGAFLLGNYGKFYQVRYLYTTIFCHSFIAERFPAHVGKPINTGASEYNIGI